jgi:hypothetical protein
MFGDTRGMLMLRFLSCAALAVAAVPVQAAYVFEAYGRVDAYRYDGKSPTVHWAIGDFAFNGRCGTPNCDGYIINEYKFATSHDLYMKVRLAMEFDYVDAPIASFLDGTLRPVTGLSFYADPKRTGYPLIWFDLFPVLGRVYDDGTVPTGGDDEVSLSIFNLRPLPEPATWVTMVIGFACIGAASRSRGSFRPRVLVARA